MTTINTAFAQGTLANRPAAAASNNGFYYLATDQNGGTLYQSTGSAWVQLAAPVSAPGFANPMTAPGDLIVGGTNGLAQRLPSVASSVLKTDGSGNVSWGTPATGAWVKIQDTTLTASQAVISFASIPQGYRHLVLEWTARIDQAANSNAFSLTCNGDGGANYTHQGFQVNNGSVTTSEGTGDTSVYELNTAAATAPAGYPSSGRVQFSDYSGTTFVKLWDSRALLMLSTNSNGMYKYDYAGAWLNTAAITSLTATAGGGSNFIAGSSFQLYGII